VSVDTVQERRAAWEVPSVTAVADEPRSQLLEYLVLRLTGIVLAVLVLGHFAVTHVATDVSHDTSSFVAGRLASALWIAWDATMLVTALAHGVVGVRIAAGDYVRRPRTRMVVDRGVPALALALLVVGVFAITKEAIP
jgi:succinate dehydrogenase hydrophobic anchor subunit